MAICLLLAGLIATGNALYRLTTKEVTLAEMGIQDKTKASWSTGDWYWSVTFKVDTTNSSDDIREVSFVAAGMQERGIRARPTGSVRTVLQSLSYQCVAPSKPLMKRSTVPMPESSRSMATKSEPSSPTASFNKLVRRLTFPKSVGGVIVCRGAFRRFFGISAAGPQERRRQALQRLAIKARRHGVGRTDMAVLQPLDSPPDAPPQQLHMLSLRAP